MQLSVPLILASQSPRRRMLLEQFGLSFAVEPSGVDETVGGKLSPEDLTKELAIRKGRSVARSHPKALVLSADTVVEHDEVVLNKPHDGAEATAMLSALSGQTHTVITGLALCHQASARTVVEAERTRVHFAPLTSAEIKRYVASGGPLDKAGGYGIQDAYGARFVQGIEGDYYNVVGLPLHRLYHMLRTYFRDLIRE
ncbi:MAG: septum formation protein Maf [Bacteroidetes bacterium]|jgi:septum formation protein|nr:septum formation protein Maf [Bacteroidota bacterium]